MRFHARRTVAIQTAVLAVVAAVLVVAMLRASHESSRLELVADCGFLAIVAATLTGAILIRSYSHSDAGQDNDIVQ